MLPGIPLSSGLFQDFLAVCLQVAIGLLRCHALEHDCLDSIPLKLALERAALRAGVPFVHGSVLREEGFAFLSLKEERLPSLYPHSGRDEDEKTRAQAMSGIAAAGIACLMAQLCTRHLCRVAEGREPIASPLYHLDYSVPELESFFS